MQKLYKLGIKTIGSDEIMLKGCECFVRQGISLLNIALDFLNTRLPNCGLKGYCIEPDSER